MQERKKSPQERRWVRSMASARGRVDGWKAQVARCEDARDSAVEMLEDYAKRMQAMVERGELGTRKGSDGEDYPQLRIVYWGEIETGSMSLLCFEIDYGLGERARVGAWGRMRSVWESCSLPFSERFLAWRRTMGHGAPHQTENVWLDIRACLKTICADLEIDLDFGPSAFPKPMGDYERQLRVDEGEWDAWVAAQGANLSRELPLPEEIQPTDEEWEDLEIRAAILLGKFTTDARNESSGGQGDAPPADRPST